MSSGKVGGRTGKAFLAHLLPDSANMFQDTKPERSQKENLQPVSAITWDEGLTFMVTADQVALVEVGESVRTWQRNDWLGMESLWHQSVSLRLSGYFQAALKSGLKRPSVVRQGKTLQSMNLKKLFVSNHRQSLLLWQDVTPLQRRRTCSSVSFSQDSASLGTATASVPPCHSKHSHNSWGSQKPLLSRKA